MAEHGLSSAFKAILKHLDRSEAISKEKSEDGRRSGNCLFIYIVLLRFINLMHPYFRYFCSASIDVSRSSDFAGFSCIVRQIVAGAVRIGQINAVGRGV
jgi:hypothetical protein